MGSHNTTHQLHHGSSGARNGRRRRWLVAGAIIGSLALAACGGDEDSASEPAAAPGLPAATEGNDFIATADEAPQNAGEPDSSGGFDLGIVGRDVIIEMRVTMSSDDIQRTVASITANASTLGGGVSSSDVDFGDQADPNGSQGYAVLVVKVPPDTVDRLLSGLDSSGEVLRINQTAQDVTEQLVDLDVRIDNAAESVANVRTFMEQAANLDDLVKLEGELTRRQTELERLEAQQRNLSERVALSTITIEVVPTSSVPEPVDDDTSIGGALRTGWDAFTSLLFGIVYVLATLLPFLVLAAIGLLIVRWAVLRRSVASVAVSEAASALPPPVDETASRAD
jgi:hypothetical protein